MANPTKYSFFRQKVTDFFDRPASIAAKLVQLLIIVLILFSVTEFAIELFGPSYFAANQSMFHWLEIIVVAVFTLEYLIRLWRQNLVFILLLIFTILLISWPFFRSSSWPLIFLFCGPRGLFDYCGWLGCCD